MLKRFFWPTSLVLGFVLLALPRQSWAFCPLCVAGTGAGVGFFRWLGVDDTIIGLWLGGFIVSVSTWLNKYLTGKEIKIKFQLPVIVVGFYSLNFILLRQLGLLSYPYNKLWGINKLILGIALGSLVVVFAFYLDQFLRSKNNGKVFISYQMVIIPIFLLALLGLIFNFTLG